MRANTTNSVYDCSSTTLPKAILRIGSTARAVTGTKITNHHCYLNIASCLQTTSFSPGSGSFSLPLTPVRSVSLETGPPLQPRFGMQDVEEVLSREFRDGEALKTEY